MTRYSIRKAYALACALLALTFGFQAYALADSKKWRANNHSDYRVKVFWTAAGCGLVKDNCRAGQVDYVCAAKILDPGEGTHYKFNGNRSRG